MIIVLSIGLLYEINLQLLWQVGPGSYLIKAGTPLAHLILIKDEPVKTIYRTPTEKELFQEFIKTL